MSYDRASSKRLEVLVIDLVEALVEAASNAIRAEGPAILHESARLRNVMLELEVRNFGGLIDGRCGVEKQARTARGEGG
jgi:hypothetical protein